MTSAVAAAEDLLVQGWEIRPMLWAALLGIAALASCTALDLARRVPEGGGRRRVIWLAGAALALGTGIWAVHFIGLMGETLPIGVGYGGLWTFSGWLSAVLASAASLALGAAQRRSPGRLAAAGLLLGLGVLAAEFQYFTDMRMAPPLVWDLRWLLATVPVAALGAAAALLLWSPSPSGRAALLRQAGAVVAMAAGLGLAHRSAAVAAQVPFDAVSLNQLVGISSATLGLLAALGSVALLVVLLLLSIVEGRMRAALRQAIARIESASRTDALTELPNRGAFERQVAATGQAALLFLGLDGFKSVNDSFGREVGDLLLKEMARRLRTAVGTDDVVARVGGDEFAVLMPGIDVETALHKAERLQAVLSETCELDGRETVMSCSIGIALSPPHTATAGAITCAEAAARAAKSQGGAGCVVFDPHMLDGAREQRELLRDLRVALIHGELELYYQPKIHAGSGEITGAEALMRWNHPKRGMVSPAVFIPIAERFGLIGAMGNWVIEEACRQIHEWRKQGLRMRVAINLSAHQLHQRDLAERIGATLRRYHVNPELLTCEITESVAMGDAQATMEAFARLAAEGLHISIDDFGTGYSSLAYLRKLPAGELKIDRSFVLDLDTVEDARAVVDAVIKLAKALSLKVVAEGVETEAHHQILRKLGCDQLQGFLFAKPMPAKALALWAMNDEGPNSLHFRDSLFHDTLPEMRS